MTRRTEMQGNSLWTMVVVSAVALTALATVAIGPDILTNFASPDSTDPDTEPTPQAGPIETPTWQPGDSWTYDVSGSLSDSGWDSLTWDGVHLAGTLTREVVSADGSQYNVSLEGTFDVGAIVDLSNEVAFGDASVMVMTTFILNDATVDGYAWYRASDLAKLAEVRTVHLSGSLATEVGTFTATYTARIETTYDPALDVWSFPLDVDETWDAASNATIRVWATWRFDGPHSHLGEGRNFTLTVPVRLLETSGAYEEVSTPAGVFSSIPVRTALPAVDVDAMSRELALAMGLGNDVVIEPHTRVVAWFNADVGNVVKATTVLDGLRVEIALVSYHRA